MTLVGLHPDVKNQRRSMKQVTFSSKVKAKKTLRVQDYTQDEMEATWYNQAELDHLKLESHLTRDEPLYHQTCYLLYVY